MQLIKALVCQMLACLVILLLGGCLSRWAIDIRLIALLQALIAATFSALLRQPVWWRLIHLSFMPALAIMLAFNLPSWLYLLIFLLLTLVFWGTVKGDVPLFLSSSAVGEAVIAIVSREKAASFVDLGAGVGTVVAPLARHLPDSRIDALERAPLPWLLACWRCRKLPNVQVRLVSLWHRNLAEYNAVFAFLSPLVMDRVAEKVRSEMREGSLFISSSFPVQDWVPETIVEVDDGHKTCLYCYRIQAGNIPADQS
ncbi:MAG: hypothetical protein LUQ11_09315 [Methylococcaceae bacterium]|nr:hypothetical protein [Methylococcaceae bacterium]